MVVVVNFVFECFVRITCCRYYFFNKVVRKVNVAPVVVNVLVNVTLLISLLL